MSLNIDHHTRRLVIKALNKHPLNISAAARLLGISSHTLNAKIKEYKLELKHTWILKE